MHAVQNCVVDQMPGSDRYIVHSYSFKFFNVGPQKQRSSHSRIWRRTRPCRRKKNKILPAMKNCVIIIYLIAKKNNLVFGFHRSFWLLSRPQIFVVFSFLHSVAFTGCKFFCLAILPVPLDGRVDCSVAHYYYYCCYYYVQVLRRAQNCRRRSRRDQ